MKTEYECLLYEDANLHKIKYDFKGHIYAL